MPSEIARAVPVEVEHVRQRMERWCQERAPGAPIPSALWAKAAKTARRHGVSRTTRALGLDYNKLKLRVQEGAPVEPAQFVESAPPALGAQCRIEIEGPSGTRIKIALPAADGAQLAMALCATVGASRDDPDHPEDAHPGGGGAGGLPPWDRWADDAVPAASELRSVLRHAVRVPHRRSRCVADAVSRPETAIQQFPE